MTTTEHDHIADDLRSLAFPVANLKLLPGNPRRGDVDAVARSYDRFGQRKPIVARRSDMTVIAGNHQLQAAQRLGWTHVAVVWTDDDDLTAKAYALADNRTGDLGSYDDAFLSALIADVSVDGDLLTATGYCRDDVDALLQRTLSDTIETATGVIDNAPTPSEASMSHNIDVFFNASPVLVKVATTAGLQPGIISKSVSKSYLASKEVLNLDINFVDNEFKDYDHAHHVWAVSQLSPRYATVRDLMTREQCDAAGIHYYTFDEVMDMADDVGEHAENVIVIPKYDCLDRIPDRFMLGYSVPTAYGGTPLDLHSFRGRRVHLLGGSWKRQFRCLSILGPSVVSLDNNHMMNIARFGCVYVDGGKVTPAAQTIPGRYGNIVPMLYSMSTILADLSRAGVTVNGRAYFSKEQGVVSELSEVFDPMSRGDGDVDDDNAGT